MKHIKRKFHFEVQIPQEDFIKDFEGIDILKEKDKLKTYKVQKGQKCFLHTDGERAIEAFPLKVDGKLYYIPEPNPVLIYFDSAQRNYKSILETRQQVLSTFDFAQEKKFSVDPHVIYNHFELCAVFITSLFTSIEAFINKIIPEDYLYKETKASRTEVYNKAQIQRYLSFDVKSKKALTEITGKAFDKNFPLKFQYINNLKEFRDAIIHTKTSSEGHTLYDHLFKASFTFKYEDALHAVRDFINFYSPGLIEECDCGKDI